MAWTNPAKNTSTWKGKLRHGHAFTWADLADYTWEDLADETWDMLEAITYTEQSKNTNNWSYSTKH